MAPDVTPENVSENPVDPRFDQELPPDLRSDPDRMTGRERRRRIILLAILILLLALLSYLTYYFVNNRKLPSLGIAPPGSDQIAPPRYLYSISGQGKSELVRPVGVGVGPDGRVYVVDFGNHRVSVFANRGAYLFSFDKTAEGPLINPVHLAVKGNEIWVSDRRLRGIFIFDLEGKYLRKFTPKNENLTWTPLAFSFDGSGAMRVTDVGNTDLHRLVYFSSDGSRTATVGQTGQVKSLFESPGSFLFPNGVAVAKSGDVYISDGDNRRVQVFTSKAAFKGFVDTSGVPRGIAIDAKQRLYVADALAHTIDVYDLKGKKLTQFGERGFAPGQFNYPNDITIDSAGKIYISDRENNQVQVWGWPVVSLPPLPPARSPWAWLIAALCLSPLLLLPLLARRRKTRIVVSPEFVDALALVGEIPAVSGKSRLKLVAPIEDKSIYEGRVVDDVDLGELIAFEEYSESDVRALMDRYKIEQRPAVLLTMAMRAKALGTEDKQIRWMAMLAEVRAVDVKEFRTIFLKRDLTETDSD